MSAYMFMLDLFSWWYRAGWAGVLTSNRRRLNTLGDMFSVTILLRTLFSPWRRIITYPGAGLDARLHAMADNFVSRCIGFVVRFFVLLAAFVAFVCMLVAAVIEVVLWPFVPLGGVALLVWGLF